MSKLILDWQKIPDDIEKIVMNLWIGPAVYAENKEFLAMNYIDAIVGITNIKYQFIRYINPQLIIEQLKNGKRVYIIRTNNNSEKIDQYISFLKKEKIIK